MLRFADLGRPEYFHKVARLGFRKVVEVLAQIHLVKETRGAGAIGIPPAPDAFAIALTADHQAFESGMIEMEGAFRPQHLDRFHENEIGGAGAITRRRRVRNDEEFARFEMRGLLQSDGGHSRNGVATAFRHLPNLLENKIVIGAGGKLGEKGRLGAEEESQSGDDFREALQGQARQIELETVEGNQGAAIFNRRLSAVVVAAAVSGGRNR